MANSQYYQDLVGDHIRDNINELSPSKAVLGGTLQVTKIEFQTGNKVLVEYEDGHIALSAIASYELLTDNIVRIDSFELVGK